jgi:hypothetical protein
MFRPNQPVPGDNPAVHKCNHNTRVPFNANAIQRTLPVCFSTKQLSGEIPPNKFCSDLSAVIRCMLPVINENCGEKPANLLLKFIGLEFSSFETLYRQLGFDTPLPVSCRSLIKHALANNQRQIQKPFSRATAKFYKFYLNNGAAKSAMQIGWAVLMLLIPLLLMVGRKLSAPLVNYSPPSPPFHCAHLK